MNLIDADELLKWLSHEIIYANDKEIPDCVAHCAALHEVELYVGVMLAKSPCAGGEFIGFPEEAE